MNAKPKALYAALVLGTALPLGALAAQSSLPQPMTHNGITYLSGGVGRDEATAIKREAKHYPLSMTFSADRNNEYLADVNVTIENAKGKILLSAVSGGPIMLVKLPSGSYTVDARVEGKTLRRHVMVGRHGNVRLNFHWKRV